ncbi:hypothetical protein LOTGIDRAFT_164104 [Lottia gigantea]|uniref:Uncharacterized protein n=1 Tax=Lottia gigantea TaxID=225164 RepID=V4A686_LOTGI|nr:hypothetical protein LOTGIDRAFT_164104 [Lottia gigantea]ESO90515.1 hypothetical protein LOTGIDRAFT_164104 [Lottia gigantea]
MAVRVKRSPSEYVASTIQSLFAYVQLRRRWESLCCKEVNDIEHKALKEMQPYICQHSGFRANCLNRDVLDVPVSLMEFVEVDGPIDDNEPISECDFKIKDGTPNENRGPQTNTTLENNFFPSLFTKLVLEAGSNPIETIKHPGEFDTMLKTVLYPKDFDSVSGWIPDVGDGSVLKEPVRNDADEAGMRVIARNTIERVGQAANHGFEKRVLQYNNTVDNDSWDNYINWKLYPLFGLLEHRKVSIGLPYIIHLQREINDDKIFFGENASNASLEITNLQLYILLNQ